MPRRTTILLTGFGPFPGMPENASAMLVTKLAHLAARRFRGRRVVSRVLPTDWEAAPARLADLYARERPKLALHFGVSGRTKGFAVETLARNKRGAMPDAKGVLPSSPWIAADGPATLASRLPVVEIVARLAAQGLPARLSHNAGNYICNAVLYAALAQPQDPRSSVMTGFIHIPATLRRQGEPVARNVSRLGSHSTLEPRSTLEPHSTLESRSTLDWEGALLGGLEIIRVCLGRPPPARGHMKRPG